MGMTNTDQDQTFVIESSNFTVVNYQYRSMVRVLYEGEAGENLKIELNSNIDSINSKSRAQIVFDYFAFAENTALTGVSIVDALDFTRFVQYDLDITVWDLFVESITYIRSILKHTNDKDIFDGYLNDIIALFYKENSWNLNVNTIDDMKRFGMSLSLIEACKYGNQDCLQNAKQALELFNPITMENELDRDQKLSGYCYGIQETNEAKWDELWNYYNREQNANEQSVIRSGLSCSKDEKVLKKYLQYGIDVVRVQDKHSVINAVSNSDYGRDVSWQFIKENWDWFYKMMTDESWTRVPSVLTTVTGTFSTNDEKESVEQFRTQIEKEEKIGNLGSTFDKIIVKIDKNIKWRKDNQEAIVSYIKGNASLTQLCSLLFIILISV